MFIWKQCGFALDDKCFALSCFLIFVLALRLGLTLACVVARFEGIMGDFTWRPLVKQIGPTGGVVPPSDAAPVEGGQPTVEVDPVVEVGPIEIAPSAISLVLAKRKRDDSAGPYGHKKLRAPLSLRALWQALGLMPGAGHPSVVQDVPSAPPTVEAPTADAIVTITPAPPPPPIVLVQEATLVASEVSALVALVGSAMVLLSTIAASLLSAGVVTTSTPMVPPPSSLTPMIPPSTALASTSTFSHPRVSLNHIYTSNCGAWGTNPNRRP